MEANFDVFDFKLTNIDMDVMELLDQRSFLEIIILRLVLKGYYNSNKT